MLQDYIKVNMIAFCGHMFFTYCVAPGHGGERESLLSPHLERWNIVPDPFIIYRAMYNEVDHRTYHKFDGQEWRPTLNWKEVTSLSPYELSVLALTILLVIFMAVCMLSFVYLFYHIMFTFCFTKLTKNDKFKYMSISKDVIENRVVNV